MVLLPEELGQNRRCDDRRGDGHQDDDCVEVRGHHTGSETDGCNDDSDLSPGHHTDSDDVESGLVQLPVTHLGSDSATDVLGGECDEDDDYRQDEHVHVREGADVHLETDVEEEERDEECGER